MSNTRIQIKINTKYNISANLRNLRQYIGIRRAEYTENNYTNKTIKK